MNATRQGANYFRRSSDPIERLQTIMTGTVSLTRQDQAEMVNINNIYQKTQQGSLTLVSGNPPTFGDFSDIGNYDQILETISTARQAFMDLPSETRKLYNNDPAVYYEKVTNEATEADLKIKAKATQEKQALAHKNSIIEAKKLLNIDE